MTSLVARYVLSNIGDPCVDCGCTTFIDCIRSGDTVCFDCGLVACRLVADVADYKHLRGYYTQESAKKRTSAPYNRVYHFNELMAQW